MLPRTWQVMDEPSANPVHYLRAWNWPLISSRYNFEIDPRSLGAKVVLSADESTYVGEWKSLGIIKTHAHFWNKMMAYVGLTKAHPTPLVRNITEINAFVMTVCLGQSLVPGEGSGDTEWWHSRPQLLHKLRSFGWDLASKWLGWTLFFKIIESWLALERPIHCSCSRGNLMGLTEQYHPSLQLECSSGKSATFAIWYTIQPGNI